MFNFIHRNGSQQKIKKEIRQRVIGYIVAALGLVAGLAWNDAIRALIDYIFPLDKNGLLAKFIYAIVISALIVIVSIYLVKLIDHEEDQKK